MRLGLLVSLAFAGCSEPAAIGSIALRLDEAGILDEVDELILDVHDAEGLSCRTNGELEGTPTADPIVRDLRLTVGEEASVDVSEGERVFVVTGRAAGERVASGCTAERLRDGQNVEIEIEVHRLVNPGECGNGDLEAGEECDDGNTAPSDGCDEACATEEGSFPQVTAASQSDPAAAAGRGGYYAVVWYDGSGGAGAFIRVGFRDLDGEPLSGGAGNDRPVNVQARGEPSAPALASNDAATVVAWEDYSGTGAEVPDVKVHFFGPDSLPIDPGDAVANTTRQGAQERPAVAVLPSGASLVVWLDDQLAPPGVAGRLFDPDAQPASDEVLEISGGQTATAAKAATLGDEFAVAYSGDGIHLRLVAGDGTLTDAISLDAAASASAPSIATLADGETALVAWIERDSVHGQIVAGGAAVGDSFEVSTTAGAALPAVAGGEGLFAIVWQAAGDVWGRLFDAEGAAIFNRVQDDGTPFQVNRDANQDQLHPGVAILGDTLLAIWQDEGTRAGEDDQPAGVRFRWLSVAPP
jgi:cysteine-rich repeat protein